MRVAFGEESVTVKIWVGWRGGILSAGASGGVIQTGSGWCKFRMGGVGRLVRSAFVRYGTGRFFHELEGGCLDGRGE